MHTYYLSNALSMIFWNQKKFKSQCVCKASVFLAKNLDFLWQMGYINGYSSIDIKNVQYFVIFLKYTAEGKPAINFLKLVNSPGNRLGKSYYKLTTLNYQHKNCIIVCSGAHGLFKLNSFSLLLDIKKPAVKNGGVLLYVIG